MKKSFRVFLVMAAALFLLTGCGFTSAASVQGQTPTSTGTDTVAGTLSAEPDSSVSKRDASGEYDAAEAVTLSPGDDLTIREAGVYILSGVYENQIIVIEAGE